MRMSDVLVELGLDPAELVLLFHGARLAVEDAYPHWSGTQLEVVGAAIQGTDTTFCLVHEADGPWLAVCPDDDEAYALMGSPACAWAEQQRWEPFFVLSGRMDGNGDWWLEEKDVPL